MVWFGYVLVGGVVMVVCFVEGCYVVMLCSGWVWGLVDDVMVVLGL